MRMITEQVVSWGVATILASLAAAVGVGGVLWHKLNVNNEQNKAIQGMNDLLLKMACHQLKISCQRALDKGCMSLAEFQELQEFYDLYVARGGNGTGKAIFEKVKKEVQIREDCDQL